MSVSRRSLFERLGVVLPTGRPALAHRTTMAYHSLAKATMNKRRFRSSFWGGMFPVGKACGRKALYGLLNLPKTEPDHPKLTATSLAGSAAENQITWRWAKAGLSISGVELPETEFEPRAQLRLQVPGLWFSVAIDDVLDLRPDWNGVLPVDVKTKSWKVIEEMKRGLKSYEPAHYAQVCGYIYICRYHHERRGWDRLGLEPASAGFLYYASRDNPADGVEFWIQPSWDEVEEALVRLALWKENFIEGRLPERPKAWKWLDDPCKYCDFKKLCKEDAKAGVTDLFDSATIRSAIEADPNYDPRVIHTRVMDRWKGTS